MANGNGSDRSRLAEAWATFDDSTKIDLIITELDRLHTRIAAGQREHREALERQQRDFADRIDKLRVEMQAGFRKVDERSQRISAIGLTILGGVVTGLILLVVQIAGR